MYTNTGDMTKQYPGLLALPYDEEQGGGGQDPNSVMAPCFSPATLPTLPTSSEMSDNSSCSTCSTTHSQEAAGTSSTSISCSPPLSSPSSTTSSLSSRKGKGKHVTFPTEADDLAQIHLIDRIRDLLVVAADDDDHHHQSHSTNNIWYTSTELNALYRQELRLNIQVQLFYGPGHVLEPHNLSWRGLEDIQFSHDRMMPIRNYVQSVLGFFVSTMTTCTGSTICTSSQESSTNEELYDDSSCLSVAAYAMSLSQSEWEVAMAQGHKDAWEVRVDREEEEEAAAKAKQVEEFPPLDSDYTSLEEGDGCEGAGMMRQLLALLSCL
ncbi:expressed unknown protein [Seminavis robusta]|uniref:Uncharacterized protein n=1 Tax=Seminavis robusta TaxID=568900 RepID=A0A9N8HRL2_9STRA|nr:expressed unknown protein [Seminavis robusta]|eukprot:Sro1586_g284190.1 n/a (323) ;mRNA; r:7840-8808